MKITIKRFSFLLPNFFLTFLIKQSLKPDNDENPEKIKQIKALIKQVKKDLIAFRKRNGKFTLLEVIDGKDYFKIVI